jgi:hypothetical protein
MKGQVAPFQNRRPVDFKSDKNTLIEDYIDMDVIIANFGFENYLWSECQRRDSVATHEDEGVRSFWLSGDRKGYIDYCIAHKKINAVDGNATPRKVASRWFNIETIIATTQGDLWIHKSGDDLWWTVSRTGDAEVELQSAYKGSTASERVFVTHKPTDPWSNKSRQGVPLRWTGLHTKAHDFLVTKAQLVKLSPSNAEYVRALINDEDLSAWHNRANWKAKAQTASKSTVRYLSGKEKALMRMVATAINTVAQADGQIVEHTVKVKMNHFESETSFKEYVEALINAQDSRCALSGLVLQFDGEYDDQEMLASLDRIDSSRHYEPGNLQVVCRFLNRWKGADGNEQFTRLLAKLQEDEAGSE